MKPRVLVVDDEPDYLQLVEFGLLKQGFEVIKAANGIQALHQARCHLPNVVVLDVMLPDLDGFSVCEILRAQPSTSDVPVIILSALDAQKARESAARLNVSCCFAKGIDLQSLGRGIQSAVEEAQVRLDARLREIEDPSGRVVDPRSFAAPLPRNTRPGQSDNGLERGGEQV